MGRLLCASALILSACQATAPTPTTLPDLGSLRLEQDRRNAQLESAAARPGPETRKPLPGKLHHVETAAATGAAILGLFFSKSSNVLLGAAVPLDQPSPPRARTSEDPASDEVPPEPIDASQLVPWVKLGPDPAP